LGDVVPPPFAPEGYTKAQEKPTKGTKQLGTVLLLFVIFVGFFVPFVALFHRHRLSEISWLVHVATTPHGNVIREQLQRDDR